jgi:hypothetical protein
MVTAAFFADVATITNDHVLKYMKYLVHIALHKHIFAALYISFTRELLQVGVLDVFKFFTYHFKPSTFNAYVAVLIVN